jgi:hypothetical protein
MKSGSTPRFVVHKLPQLAGAENPRRMLRRFVAQVGSLENARRALEFLALLEGCSEEQSRKAA